MNRLLKLIYSLFFYFYKRIKYPGRVVETNFVLPGVKLGRGVVLKEGVRVYRNVSIGDYTFVNEGTRIDPNTRSIGKFCSISHGVKIGLGPHPLNFFSTSPVFYSKSRGFVDIDLYDEFKDKGYTVIGNDVFIAANAIVYAGVIIGDGAVVAAGSVVTKNVPPYAVVGGVPAKVLRYRFSPQNVSQLLERRWWDEDVEIVSRAAVHGFVIDDFLNVLDKGK